MTDESLSAQSRRERRHKSSKEEAEAIFRLAGFTVTRIWELANGYWPRSPDYDDVRDPWWLFQTEIGLVQIGWRKRVMHIQWDACEVRAVVTEDEVTKENYYVHAYSTEKAVEYLKALRTEALTVVRAMPIRGGAREDGNG